MVGRTNIGKFSIPRQQRTTKKRTDGLRIHPAAIFSGPPRPSAGRNTENTSDRRHADSVRNRSQPPRLGAAGLPSKRHPGLCKAGVSNRTEPEHARTGHAHRYIGYGYVSVRPTLSPHGGIKTRRVPRPSFRRDVPAPWGPRRPECRCAPTSRGPTPPRWARG